MLKQGLELQEAGKAAEARAIYQRVLQIEASNSDAMNLLGVIEAQAGNLPESLKLLEKAISINNAIPDYVINLAVVLAQMDRAEEALQKIREGRKTFSGDTRFMGLELQALLSAKRYDEHIGKCQEILATEPDNAEVLLQLAMAQLQTGKSQDAYETATKARGVKPQSKAVIQTLAASAMAAREWAVAVQAFDVLTKVDPGSPVLWADWSRAEYELGNKKRAILRFEKFMEIVPQKTADHYFMLGRLYFQNRQPLKAAENLDKAMAAGFKNSELMAIRANCYIHEGYEEKAKEFFEAALAEDPDNIEAHLQYRQLIKTEKGDPIFTRLEEIKTKGGLAPQAEINLSFLLGNLHNGLEEYDKAFSCYLAGNATTKAFYEESGTVYDPDGVAQEFGRLKDVFSKSAMAASEFKGSNSKLPVFIVGMPRSGTTLLEQIISSHPLVEGRGELDAMHYIHVEMEQAFASSPAAPLDDVFEEKGNDWADQYLAALAPAHTQTKRVSDKLPANFRSLGLIAKLFPKAHLIHIHRNPLDCCVSIFCNIFDTGHAYANNLNEIGDYYRQYWDLMGRWQAVLGKRLFSLKYEDLVGAQEKTSKQVIKFCGLEWDEKCLAFHEKPDAAMTLSSIQVRRPMNTSSLGRWKRYEKHLAPLIEGLGPKLGTAKK